MSVQPPTYDTDRPILGYRRWKVKKAGGFIPANSLVGSWFDHVWPVDEPMVAECDARHYVPCCRFGPMVNDKECKCGLHLWFTLEDCKAYTTAGGTGWFQMGIAWGGGRVLFDNKWARCELSAPLCLIDPQEYGPLFIKAGPHHEAIVDITEEVREFSKKTAKRYGIPFLGHFDAISYASQFGDWVWGLEDREEGNVYIEGVD